MEIENCLVKISEIFCFVEGVKKHLESGKSLDTILPIYLINDMISTKITEEICYIVTGDPSAPYFYGLNSSVFKEKLVDKISWIVSHYKENYSLPTVVKNLTFINKNFQEIHRSGWEYVVKNIVTTSERYAKEDKLVIDTYIDKTFHWNRKFYKKKGVIPYKVNWIGFIHHTFSDFGNEYNCTKLFKVPEFIESLQYCKGLCVLSSDLAEKLKKITDVKVYVLVHPTESVPLNLEFSMDKYNKTPTVIQVGAWLRNMFSIYRLESPVPKAILKAKNTNNYFPPNLETIFNGCNLQEEPKDTMCRITFKNKFVECLYEFVAESIESVKVIDTLSNNDFDLLLSKSLVFLDLKDCSAVNTLIECIVRNTPILINKLPAVVELLGHDYPLYYNNLSDATNKFRLIKKAHKHIKNLDKEKYTMVFFLDCFWEILNECIWNN